MLTETPRTSQRVDWFPAERLGQASVDAGVRPWLIGKGLLTARIKDACGAAFSLRLMGQSTGLLDQAQRAALLLNDAAGLLREIKIFCGERVLVFAQTVIPDSTLTAHPWLAELGDAALGETLSALSGVERSSYEYAWLPSSEALAARALLGAVLKPLGLWARRSRFTLRGAPLLVQELFFPDVGQMGRGRMST